MALREVTTAVLRRVSSSTCRNARIWSSQCRYYADERPVQSSENRDLESSTFTTSNVGPPADFDPLERSRKHGRLLPRSSYQRRSPRYYRGPYNPNQPLKASNPNSREFIPGPFTLPRLEQTYHDTFAPDLMTLAYDHLPPGQERAKKGERLRQWTGDSPYFKNRPLRGPRGGDVLRLLRQPFSFNNIPQLERVTVHSMFKEAMNDTGYKSVASMALQAITNVRVTERKIKKPLATWNLTKGSKLSATAELRGEDMYHFLSKLVDVVMPKFKDYRGAKGSSGDNSGNITLGLTPEQVAMFPEIEINYDAYPQKMIPGCHVIIHTSARSDRDARLLLQSIGIPFYGKLVD